MLINNLGSLKAELARYMFHQRFEPDYDTAVQNFEAAANRRLRVRQMEHVTNLATTSLSDPKFEQGFCDLPHDYLAWRTVLWKGRTPFVELDYVHPAYLRSTWLETDHGNPKVFTVEDGTFFAAPIDNTPYIFEMHFYRKLDTILATQDGDNATNWLIAEHPDAYLFGALTELFALGRNADAAVLWKQRRDETFAEIIRLSSFTTGATSALVRSAEYF